MTDQVLIRTTTDGEDYAVETEDHLGTVYFQNKENAFEYAQECFDG